MNENAAAGQSSGSSTGSAGRLRMTVLDNTARKADGVDSQGKRVALSTQLPPDPFLQISNTLQDRDPVGIASIELRNEQPSGIQATRGALITIAPPVAFEDLADIYSASSILPQCGRAVSRFVEEQGFELVPSIKPDDTTPDAIKQAMADEREVLESFFRQAPPPGAGWTDTLRNTREDLEELGWRALEILRSPSKAQQGAGQPPAQQQPQQGIQYAADAYNAGTKATKQATKASQGTDLVEAGQTVPGQASEDPLGSVVGVEHLDASTLRWMESSEPIEVVEWYWERQVTRQPGPDGAEVELTLPTYRSRNAWRRFRLLAHIRNAGARAVYFREYGDPRIVDKDTGAVLGNYQTGQFPDLTQHPPRTWANELLVQAQYATRWAPYGRPWWYGVATAAMGITAAEEANLSAIESPEIPRLIITSEGSDTTPSDLSRVDDEVKDKRRGNPAAHGRMMLLEVEPHVVGDMAGADPRAIRPALGVHQIKVLPDDGLFVEFDDQARTKVRSARGLSSMAVGLSNEYTYASAKAALDVEEQLVYRPEREDLDRLVNRLLVSNRVLWWRYQSKQARFTSPEDQAAAVTAADAGGAMTPNMHRDVLGALLGREMARVEEAWGDQPFQVTMEQVKLLGGLGEADNGPATNEEGTVAEKGAVRLHNASKGTEPVVRALLHLRSALLATKAGSNL